MAKMLTDAELKRTGDNVTWALGQGPQVMSVEIVQRLLSHIEAQAEQLAATERVVEDWVRLEQRQVDSLYEVGDQLQQARADLALQCDLAREAEAAAASARRAEAAAYENCDSITAAMRRVLTGYEELEAAVILDEQCWTLNEPNDSPWPILYGRHYDRAMALQSERNDALSGAAGKAMLDELARLRAVAEAAVSVKEMLDALRIEGGVGNVLREDERAFWHERAENLREVLRAAGYLKEEVSSAKVAE